MSWLELGPKKLYEAQLPPTIHINRFPCWLELQPLTRQHWTEKWELEFGVLSRWFPANEKGGVLPTGATRWMSRNGLVHTVDLHPFQYLADNGEPSCIVAYYLPTQEPKSLEPTRPGMIWRLLPAEVQMLNDHLLTDMPLTKLPTGSLSGLEQAMRELIGQRGYFVPIGQWPEVQTLNGFTYLQVVK